MKFLRFSAAEAAVAAAPPPQDDSPFSRRLASDERERGRAGCGSRFFGEAPPRRPCGTRTSPRSTTPTSRRQRTPYIVFELVDGPTLGHLLAHAGRLEVARALAVLCDVAGAGRAARPRDRAPRRQAVQRAGRPRGPGRGDRLRPGRATGPRRAEAGSTAGTPAYMGRPRRSAAGRRRGATSTRWPSSPARCSPGDCRSRGPTPTCGTARVAPAADRRPPRRRGRGADRGAGASRPQAGRLPTQERARTRPRARRAQVPAMAARVAAARPALVRLVTAVADGGVGSEDGGPGSAARRSASEPAPPTPSPSTTPAAGAAASRGLSPQYTETLARTAALKRVRSASSSTDATSPQPGHVPASPDDVDGAGDPQRPRARPGAAGGHHPDAVVQLRREGEPSPSRFTRAGVARRGRKPPGARKNRRKLRRFFE